MVVASDSLGPWKVLLAGVLAAAAILSVWSALPDETLLEQLVLIDFDESRHYLSEAQLRGFRLLVRAVAAVLLLGAGSLWLFRRRAAPALAELARDAAAVLREVVAPAASDSPATRRWLVAIVAIGTALRLLWINQPLQFDESATYNLFVSRSFFNTLTDYTAPNNHILHSMFVRVSALLFGASPISLRLPAFLAGVAVVPLTYLTARRLFPAPAALAGVALAAVHPALTGFSADGRGYTLLICATLALFLFGSVLSERRSIGAWTLFAAAGVIGAFTIPTMLYSLAAASLWALWNAPRRRLRSLVLETAVAAVVIAGATAALYAPAVARTGISALVSTQYVKSERIDRIRYKGPQLADRVERDWSEGLPPGAYWIGGLAVLISVLNRDSRRLLLSVAAGVIVISLARQVIPFSRVLVFAAPLLSIAAGVGLAEVYRRLPRAPGYSGAAWVGLAAALAVFAAANPRKDEANIEAQALARELRNDLGPREAILPSYGLTAAMRYWFVREGLPRGRVLDPNPRYPEAPPLEDFDHVILVQPPRRGRRWRTILRYDDPALARFRYRVAEKSEHLEIVHFTMEPYPPSRP